jgi:hypothetical protein
MTKRGSKPLSNEEKPEPPREGEPTASFPLHEHIGRQLKAMFDEVLSQPVPDKFRELLEELERKQPKN